MPHVVVVGAGVSGLAAARALRDAGFDVTVLEGSAVPGGKLRTSEVAGVDVDEGAEQLLVRRPEAVALVGRLGLGADVVHPTASSASVLVGGQLRALPARTLLGVPSSLRSLRGVLTPAEIARAAADLLLPPSSGGDDISVGALVGRRFGRGVLDRLVDPLLGGVYAGRADALSLRATLPQLEPGGRSLMAAVRRVIPPVSAGAPVFGTLTGGLQRLTDALAATPGLRLVTGRSVRRLERTGGGWLVVHGPTTDEQAVPADGVVLAVPAAPGRRLLADVVPAAAAELAQIDYASMAIIALALPAGALPATRGSGYLLPAVEGRRVKAVTFTTAKWGHLRGAGVEVVRASIGRHGDVDDLQRDDTDLVRLAVEELQTTLGVSAAPVATRVTRWGGALPQYAVGHLDRVARIRAAVAQQPALAVCGAAYDGVGVPACIGSGERAAREVAAALRSRQAE